MKRKKIKKYADSTNKAGADLKTSAEIDIPKRRRGNQKKKETHKPKQ